MVKATDLFITICAVSVEWRPNMKRTLVSIIGIVFILLITLIINYQLKYSVDSSKENIENKIVIFMNKSKPLQNINNIKIAKECNIDTTKYVLFILNNKLAYAELRKGLNSKYRIISVTTDINVLRCEIIKTNISKYLLILGKNDDLQIDRIKAKVGADDYNVTIPKEQYFFSYCQVPTWASLAEDPTTVRIIDKEDNDITERISIE